MDRGRDARQVREVRALLLEWGALLVADAPEAADEYDCMTAPLLGHLDDGADAATLHDWITREVEDHFGLSPDAAADRALADALVAWWRHQGCVSARSARPRTR